MKYVPLQEASSELYEKLGLMSGLEIHQQVLTEKKLFCRCPAGRYSKRWDAEILRHMRPTLSELGEYDGTALMEFKTRKEILYRLTKGTVCTYEFDDTPPFEINEDALDIALEITLLLKCNLVSELHIARKQYLDGSIPTGFQRTTILGVDGWVPFGDGRIRIRQLALEEDSCRQMADEGHLRTFIADRLGMPLVETVTYPDMHTPADVAAVAQLLRHLVRATGKVRTGAGAAREDVNVSVRGGTRCEIKGVPSIRRIPLLVHDEAFRQAGLLEIAEELRRRGIKAVGLRSEERDVTARLRGTRYVPIASALENGMRARGVVLRGFDGILRHPLLPGRSFLQEVSDRVRVIACIDHVPNVISSDSPEGAISPDRWMAVRKALGAKEHDAVVLVWGKEADLPTAAAEIAFRAKEAVEGVPNETRQALPDGTTAFERILPGPDRMYPDTDLPPKGIGDERIEAARKRLPEPPWEREERYLQSLPEQLARDLAVSPFAPAYDRLAREHGLKVFPAWLLTQRMRALKRGGLDVTRLDADVLSRLFGLFVKGRVKKRGLLLLVELFLEGRQGDPETWIEAYGLDPAPEDELDGAVGRVVQEALGREFPVKGDRVRWAMGRIMGSMGLRVDGAQARDKVEGALALDAGRRREEAEPFPGAAV